MQQPSTPAETDFKHMSTVSETVIRPEGIVQKAHLNGVADSSALSFQRLYSDDAVLKLWKTATEHLAREVSSTAEVKVVCTPVAYTHLFRILRKISQRLSHSQETALANMRIEMLNSGPAASSPAACIASSRDRSSTLNTSSSVVARNMSTTSRARF